MNLYNIECFNDVMWNVHRHFKNTRDASNMQPLIDTKGNVVIADEFQDRRTRSELLYMETILRRILLPSYEMLHDNSK